MSYIFFMLLELIIHRLIFASTFWFFRVVSLSHHSMTTVMLELNFFYPKIPLTHFNPVLRSHIETSYFIRIANQMTGFYMKCNTGLKSITVIIWRSAPAWMNAPFEWVLLFTAEKFNERPGLNERPLKLGKVRSFGNLQSLQRCSFR